MAKTALSEEAGMTNDRRAMPRRHDLDALRAFAMLLGIALHAALSFSDAPWVVQDEARGQEDLFSLAVAWIHGFRMPLFFLMSGFFTAMLWRRRGLGALLRQRGLRVMVPLLLAGVTIIPAMNWTIDFIVEKGAEEAAAEVNEVDPKRNVWLAAASNDRAMLDEQLALGAELDAPDPAFGVTPLAWAAMQGHNAMALELLRRGADVNAGNRDGSTPLHGALFMGRASTAQLLLDNGAKVNARNNNRETPLDSAEAETEVTAYIAAILGLPFDEQAVEKGRRRAALLLAARGGELNAALEADTLSPDGKSEDAEAWSESIAPWYWQFVYAEGLTFAEEGEEPFNPIHTSVFHHLWFLWFLLWLVAGFAAFAAVADRRGGRGPLLPARLVLSPWLWVWALPLTMALQWFMGLEGGGTHPHLRAGHVGGPHPATARPVVLCRLLRVRGCLLRPQRRRRAHQPGLAGHAAAGGAGGLSTGDGVHQRRDLRVPGLGRRAWAPPMAVSGASGSVSVAHDAGVHGPVPMPAQERKSRGAVRLRLGLLAIHNTPAARHPIAVRHERLAIAGVGEICLHLRGRNGGVAPMLSRVRALHAAGDSAERAPDAQRGRGLNAALVRPWRSRISPMRLDDLRWKHARGIHLSHT